MDLPTPPVNVQVVQLQFGDPYGKDTCARVGINLDGQSLGPAPSSSCREGRGKIEILEPYGWPPLAPPLVHVHDHRGTRLAASLAWR